MGRIKTTFVKNTAKNLVEKYPEAFSGKFEENKKALERFASFESRKMRNLVAGYISSVKNAKPFVQRAMTEERPRESRFGTRTGSRRPDSRRQRRY